MPTAQQRDWGDDAAGSSVGRSYREPVAGSVRGNELRDGNQVSGLNGVERSKAPNRQPRPVDQQIGPGPQIDHPDDERPESHHDQKRRDPACRLPAGQCAHADRGGDAGE